jgi:YHS domain-containing protein
MEPVIDPVCGRTFERDDAYATMVTDNRDYFFCSQECLDLFQESPQDYINIPPVNPAHPDERQDPEDDDRHDPYT